MIKTILTMNTKIKKPKKSAKNKSTEQALCDKIWEALKLCYDPEIPVNVVDLGFIYGVEVKLSDNKPKPYDAFIRMTLTTPACAMGTIIVDEIKARVSALEEINAVNVELVFDPPWDRSMISMRAKLELGIS